MEGQEVIVTKCDHPEWSNTLFLMQMHTDLLEVLACKVCGVLRLRSLDDAGE